VTLFDDLLERAFEERLANHTTRSREMRVAAIWAAYGRT